jgi:hypothetical protein
LIIVPEGMTFPEDWTYTGNRKLVDGLFFVDPPDP